MDRIALAATVFMLILSCRTVPEVEVVPSESSLQAEKPAAPAQIQTLPLPEAQDLPPLKTAPPGIELEAQKLLEQLSIRQRIGQRFICAIPGNRISDPIQSMIAESYIGGIILTGQNIVSRRQIRQFTFDLQEAARKNSPSIGLFIAVDQEGGRVHRFELDHITRFPAPFTWSEYNDPYFVGAAAYIIGKEIGELGCNMNFAPVLDLTDKGDDSVIGDRSMGEDPERVGRYGIYYIYGATRAGIAAVIKHFPGHGSTRLDSHKLLPVVEKDLEALQGQDLLPFMRAINYNAEALMTAHILFPRLDAVYPATLSEKILNGLLRQEMGYNGVVITDDIGMKALVEHFTLEEIITLSIRAGADILLDLGSFDPAVLVETTYALYKSGALSLEQIDEGALRVLALKIKYGLAAPK